MSNDEVTERAVEMLRQAMASGAVAFVEKVRAGEVDPSAPMTEAFGDFPREFLSIRAGLFDGLLVSPEHDAAVAALPLPVDGCACTPHEQSAGGVYTEYLLEYEPACPEHSEHLWDPKQGAWVLRSERDAAVAAKALREFTEPEAMDLWWTASDDGWAVPEDLPKKFLAAVADRIEREAGESNADT